MPHISLVFGEDVGFRNSPFDSFPALESLEGGLWNPTSREKRARYGAPGIGSRKEKTEVAREREKLVDLHTPEGVTEHLMHLPHGRVPPAQGPCFDAGDVTDAQPHAACKRHGCETGGFRRRPQEYGSDDSPVAMAASRAADSSVFVLCVSAMIWLSGTP